jgi:pyrroline-5-carboxylate reductase
MTCIPSAGLRDCNTRARNNRTSIAKQRSYKHALQQEKTVICGVRPEAIKQDLTQLEL